MPNYSLFFERYEAHAREADALFARIRAEFPELVVCKEQCSSCCHAMFDLALVEALYLNAKFMERFPSGAERDAVLNEADNVDRQTAKIKRDIFKASKEGKDSNEILADAAAVTIRCPLLGKDDRCIMYDVRPITCRLYGVPTSIGGRSHTCGKTGFVRGQRYPTVALDKIQQRLAGLTRDLTASINTAYKDLASMYVPVSTALITVYSDDYLGIGGIPKEAE